MLFNFGTGNYKPQHSLIGKKIKTPPEYEFGDLNNTWYIQLSTLDIDICTYGTRAGIKTPELNE